MPGGPEGSLPGVHHPIFRGKPVNYDPRERFIAEILEKRGDYNVFHAFWTDTNNKQDVTWFYGLQFVPTTVNQEDVVTASGNF